MNCKLLIDGIFCYLLFLGTYLTLETFVIFCWRQLPGYLIAALESNYWYIVINRQAASIA